VAEVPNKHKVRNYHTDGNSQPVKSNAWTRVLDVLCSCDLDLHLMTFIYKLDPYSLEIH